jgi:hypothetical protein
MHLKVSFLFVACLSEAICSASFASIQNERHGQSRNTSESGGQAKEFRAKRLVCLCVMFWSGVKDIKKEDPESAVKDTRESERIKVSKVRKQSSFVAETARRKDWSQFVPTRQ